MNWRRHLILLLFAGVGSALPLIFPWLISTLPVVAAAIALFFSQLCHQSPDRSFALAGVTLPVCARCLAMYVGGFVGIAAYPMSGLQCGQARKIMPFLLGSLSLLAMDVGFDETGLRKNTFYSRSLTGALFGAACGMLVASVLQKSGSQHSSRRHTPSPQVNIPVSK